MAGHHPHHHGHHHSADASTGRIAVAFTLNACFTVVELVGGLLTNSTAIMADAVHDLGDTLSIGLGWFLQRVSNKSADEKFSYGYRRFSLLGAVVNAAVLIAGSLLILWEAIPRLWNPQMPVVEGMMALAVLGVVVNGAAATGLRQGRTLNERVLNLHLLEDVLGWLAVLAVSIVLWFYPLPILDPLLSIGFTLFILWRVIQSIREALAIFLQSVPDQQMLENIRQCLTAMPPIRDVHHLHLWSLDGDHHVLTAHLNLHKNLPSDAIVALKQDVERALSDYALAHTTIELEFPGENCRDASGQQNGGRG